MLRTDRIAPMEPPLRDAPAIDAFLSSRRHRICKLAQSLQQS